MNSAPQTPPLPRQPNPGHPPSIGGTHHGAARQRALGAAAILWFLVTALGQWVFVCYIIASYIPLLANEGLAGLEHTTLPNGYVANDSLGNLSIAFHLLIAIVIIGGGPLQLIPQIRQRFPAFHRLIGRIYVMTAILTSCAGLYLVWTRGVPGGWAGHIAISLDGILILLFAVVAVLFALKRQIDRHRRWALRLFMVVSAVWFFRIGLMFWFMATGGIGIDMETFQGPFLTFIYFGQMAIPLLVLELYFWAQRSRQPALTYSAALVILASAGVTAAGTLAASMGMWFP